MRPVQIPIGARVVVTTRAARPRGVILSCGRNWSAGVNVDYCQVKIDGEETTLNYHANQLRVIGEQSA